MAVAPIARGNAGAANVRIADIARSGGSTNPAGTSRAAIARRGVTTDSSMNVTRAPLAVSEHVGQTALPKSPTALAARTEGNNTIAAGNPVPAINGGGAKNSSGGTGGTPLLSMNAGDRS
jgi:hypothetical protein